MKSFADPCSFEQVLINLAVNARDAMPKGGRFSIDVSNVSAHDLPDGERPIDKTAFVRLRVRDTGCGMDESTKARAFDPFFTTKEVGKGTGMGLAMVYGIVKQHNGLIQFDSTVGVGTTFEIFFPATELNGSAANQDAEHTNEHNQGVGETILVVEDEPLLRDFLQEALESFGYRVLSAATGLEALELWKDARDPIALLLTDMVMPGGLSGRELAARLKQEKPDLKVIYSSGYSFEVLGKDFKSDSSDVFLCKPYQSDDLANAVSRCFKCKEHSKAA